MKKGSRFKVQGSRFFTLEACNLKLYFRTKPSCSFGAPRIMRINRNGRFKTRTYRAPMEVCFFKFRNPKSEIGIYFRIKGL